MPRLALAEALAQIDLLIRPAGDLYFAELRAQHRKLGFVPSLLRSVAFGAAPGGQSVFDAIQHLRSAEGRGPAASAPLDFVSAGWRRQIRSPDGSIDKLAYRLCLLDSLRTAIRRRDVFTSPSLRYADPRLGLLSGPAWTAARPAICRTLGLSVDGPAEIDRLSSHLDTTYRMTAGRLPRNAGVRMENDELVLSALDKLEEPPSLIALRAAVTARLPRVDLPELLLEIHARTGFAGGFTHASEGNARAGDLATSLCAVLLAEACNTGFEPLIRLDNPALSRSRLSWVRQNYIRAETLSLSNAALVAAQNRIGLAKIWGGGDVASADGLRFVVPIRTLHAGPNPRYFGQEGGVTFYNLVSDQFTGLNGITVPGTLRDSLSLLSVVLEQQTELQPTEIMSDTGAYTDTIFGIFHLLGYQFSPRLADIGGTRFWRVDRTADYGALNILASHCIDMTLIAAHWEDLLRLAASLKLGTVQASGLIRTLQTRDRPTRLAQALEQLGRLVKTLYLLHFIDDETYRRRILVQLNRGEGRHQLARVVFHGKRGELRQRYREGQEDQLGSFGLVVNAIILWNTIYMDAALNQLRAEGFDVRDEGLDVAEVLHGAGMTVSIVNPSRVKAYGQSELARNKTDKLDAALIARFCRAQRPVPWTPPAAHLRELRELMRRCDGLKAMRVQEINRQKSGMASATVAASIADHIEWLERQIEETMAAVRVVVAADPTLERNYALVLTIPGIRPVTACVMRHPRSRPVATQGPIHPRYPLLVTGAKPWAGVSFGACRM